ncbi:MAG: hypothetical protein UV73_C0007G0038 [Candidatus Gottesmanbacteria bacterium GW2011_GWA2_43_14]|uniref:Uncharacterized protein n=1 Tax=Candidatus Gottesmanbacteria bacterium GW2011_GWA2_43_14 TaxID=1618443 RepID=A0A0G1DIF4_9BACT|nr:MAG: hypothetical protein UV73_C0007G0038 [Candidatus Gottesmanbacteria bacterium GW2011_GWA2_43_14]
MNSNGGIEQIEIYIRNYRTLLKSAGFVRVEKLIEAHKDADSILHEKAGSDKIDTAAFIYSLLRLPPTMSMVKKIILGQSIRVFKNNRFGHIDDWTEVTAPGRRRKMYFNGRDTLAVYIASVTDVDDLITLSTAFQIEWNKLHAKLAKSRDVKKSMEILLDQEDIAKIQKIWGDDYHKFLTAVKYRKIDFTVHLLSGSYMEYARATQHWWDHIDKSLPEIKFLDRPVYFISSNTHSVVNLITRFAKNYEKEIVADLYKSGDDNLINLWREKEKESADVSREYFLNYLSKKSLRKSGHLTELKNLSEKKLGITTIRAKHFLDIDAQIIPVARLPLSGLPQLLNLDLKALSKSKSIIINIDYPLGWAAYQILTEIGQNVGQMLGIYIMGKAATLTGQVGDILLPNTVFDVHTKNTYAISNCFRAADFKNIYSSGLILENQKTVTTKGTYLESAKMIENWFRQGYTDIEMEGGPYLNAAYEFIYYNRYEENEFINLSPTPFELGIAHYASDTPYSKAKNLGVRNLSYEGVESTYAVSQAILKKIVEREMTLLK